MRATLQGVIDEFAPEDQKRIHAKTEVLAQDKIQHADSHAEIRSAWIKTQAEVTRVLNVKQNAVAQLEKRLDLLISTLRKPVEAMGGELALRLRRAPARSSCLMGSAPLRMVKSSMPKLARPRAATARKQAATAANRVQVGKAKVAKGKAVVA